MSRSLPFLFTFTPLPYFKIKKIIHILAYEKNSYLRFGCHVGDNGYGR